MPTFEQRYDSELFLNTSNQTTVLVHFLRQLFEALGCEDMRITVSDDPTSATKTIIARWTEKEKENEE